MTQKERVLRMLKDAGPEGVRSDEFIKQYMPRGAARIQDLKDEGVFITSEREGKYTRYRLIGNAGVDSGPAPGQVVVRAAVDSGVAAGDPPTSLAPPDRSVPSMFDPDDCLDWNGRAA